MSSRTAAWVAWSACGSSLVLILCGGLLGTLYGTSTQESLFSIFLVSSALVGGVVASRRPANPVGWLFLGAALSLAFETFAVEYAVYGNITEPGALPFASAMAWLAAWPELLGGMLFFVFLPLYFPEGRLVSPRWRPVARLAALFTVANLAVVALLPGKVRYNSEIINPLGIEALRPIRDPSETVGLALYMAFILVSLASLVVRFRRSRGEERQQLKWFTYAVSVVLVWFLVNWPIQDAIPDLFPVLDDLVISGIQVAAGVAILRYRLYDIDLVINRTLVYGALTACIIGIYVLIVGYLDALLQTEENLAISLVATGVVAVLFAPLRERLQRGVNRLMYGERDEPYAVLSRLGQRLEGTLAPRAVLPAIVETVAQALKIPYAGISLKRDGGFETAAEYGTPSGEPLVLPLTYQNETVGRLTLSPRAKDESFIPADRHLLEDLARQAGIAAYVVRLTADLQRSREKLVLAREEERRRLRRDLHDELAPTLAALGLAADTVGELIPADPKKAVALNSELQAQIRSTVGEVRRLVYDLRPPTLDEFGLAEAVRQRAARYNASEENGGLRITVEASGLPPELPAAVEVAAYRIVQEALMNVVRHAGAGACAVRLACPEGRMLDIEVTDDGVGLPESPEFGVGLRSMQERATELGGSCRIENATPAGTRIFARLPLAEPAGLTEG